jgi:hypothetical protein
MQSRIEEALAMKKLQIPSVVILVVGLVIFTWGTAVLLLLGADSTWSTVVIVTGILIAWTAFIDILQLGQRRAWWR